MGDIGVAVRLDITSRTKQKRKSKKISFLSEEEIERLISVIDSIRDRPFPPWQIMPTFGSPRPACSIYETTIPSGPDLYPPAQGFEFRPSPPDAQGRPGT